MATCTEIVIAGINTTSGASDTDRIVVTDADGLIDPSFLTERVQDIVGAFVATSTSITWTYDDTSGTLSGSITDRDYGDITVSATGATWTIDNSAVTYAKIQNVSATDKILGRATAGAGVVEEIACTAAGRALLDDTDASAQRTTLGLGTMAVEAEADYGALADAETVTGAWTFSAALTASGGIATTTLTASGAVSQTMSIPTYTQQSPDASKRYALSANISDAVDGGWRLRRWDGAAYQNMYHARPTTSVMHRWADDAGTTIAEATSVGLEAKKALLVQDVHALTAVTTAAQTRTLDLSNGAVQTLSANQNFTLAVSGPSGKAGDITLYVYNSSAGSVVLTAGSDYIGIGGTSTLTWGAGNTLMVRVHWNGTDGWHLSSTDGAGDLRPT